MDKKLKKWLAKNDSIPKTKKKKKKRNTISYNANDIIPETKKDKKKRKKLAKAHKKFLRSLNFAQKAFLETKLANVAWRLNNLYTIRDKWSQLGIMRLNLAQRIVLDSKHNKKIILKSRQQGISTYYVAYNLDKCIFTDGVSAGIQSYGLDESNKLKDRALLMIDNLDEEIVELLGIKVVSNNQKGITFSNGSILKIGNFRGDTLQALHISELAKIARLYPDRANELKTGALQAIASDNEVSIESTAEQPTGLFWDMWTRAYLKKQLGLKLSPLDYDAIFLSWTDDPDCVLRDEYIISPEAKDYAKELKRDAGIKLTKQQMWWLSAKMEELGDDFNREYPATPDLAFKQSVEGSFFLKQYRRIVREKRIGTFPHDPNHPVYISFDLGINDEMVMLFVQVINGQPRVIHEYHNTGEGFKHYVDVMFNLMDNNGYRYKTVFLPHDMNVRELGSGVTRLETIRNMGVTNVHVLPKLSFKESINIARTFIDATLIHAKCENTVLAIQNYRKKYDNQLGIYTDTDVHDIHSNYSASLRYMAQGLGYTAVSSANQHSRQHKRSKLRTKQEEYFEEYNPPDNRDFAVY